MNTLSETLINQIAATLEEEPYLTMAFLFGSYAKGTARSNSDLDIAVYLKEPYGMAPVQKIWGQIESLSKKEVDLIILNTAPASLCWSALRGIKLIIKDQKQYLQYMLDCSREAEDFQEFLFDLWRLRHAYKEVDNHATPLQ